MGEAPDLREQEDCPSPEACAHSCDQHEYVRLLTVPDEPAMQHLLDALNVSGLHPELACSAGVGAPFLAGLTDPVADHVHYTVTDPDQGVVHCCECSHPGVRPNEWDPNSWRPAYPVTALVTEWPDLERVADEDYIDPWWAPVLPPGKTSGETS